MAHVSVRSVTPRQIGLVGLCFLSLLSLPGCSQTFNPTRQRTVEARELYRDSAFGQESIKRDRISCLTARLSFGHETYGRALMQGLVETMEAHLASDGVVHPNLVASHINEAGLAADYATMLTNYDKTNILDRHTLRKIAEATGVRYFAVPILVNFREDNSTRISLFGLRLAKTAWANARFQLQIWDGYSGRIVWEGISDLTIAQEMIRESPVQFEDTVQATWENLIQKIPAQAISPVDADGPA